MPYADKEKRRAYDLEWGRKRAKAQPEYMLWKNAKKGQGTKA